LSPLFAMPRSARRPKLPQRHAVRQLYCPTAAVHSIEIAPYVLFCCCCCLFSKHCFETKLLICLLFAIKLMIELDSLDFVPTPLLQISQHSRTKSLKTNARIFFTCISTPSVNLFWFPKRWCP